jgi:hypothetical protein
VKPFLTFGSRVFLKVLSTSATSVALGHGRMKSSPQEHWWPMASRRLVMVPQWLVYRNVSIIVIYISIHINIRKCIGYVSTNSSITSYLDNSLNICDSFLKCGSKFSSGSHVMRVQSDLLQVLSTWQDLFMQCFKAVKLCFSMCGSSVPTVATKKNYGWLRSMANDHNSWSKSAMLDPPNPLLNSPGWTYFRMGICA